MQALAYLKHTGKLFYKHNAFPEQITFFATPKCNARCKHCFAWKSLDDDSQEILSVQEIDKISRTIAHFTYLLIGGGEPFLRPDLGEIVNIFYKNNNVLNVSISTNGSLPQQTIRVVKEILKSFNNNLTVNVSFDEIGPRHDEIRQLPGIFKKAAETYLRLKELKSKHPNLNAGIIMTCSPYNDKTLSKIYLWLKENLKPYSIVMNYMRGDVKNKEDLPRVDLDAYEEVMGMIEGDNLSQEIPGHSRFFFSDFNLASKMLMRKVISDTIRDSSFQLPCFAGILNCVLWYNGDIYPCEMLDMKMGNLRENDYDFRKIWTSQGAVRVRNFIKETKCFCTEECNINMNILFNLYYLPKLLRNVMRIKGFRLIKKLRK